MVGPLFYDRPMRSIQLLLLFAGAALSGCAPDRNEHANAIAEQAGLERSSTKTTSFRITTFSRLTRPDQPLYVYIEGDGYAWRSISQPSLDPTPRKALGLSLAAIDPASNVLYIARPCQFTPLSSDPNCTMHFWTDGRFAPEVIASIDQVIDHFAVNGQQIHLVGYSGGGAVATLIASSRSDVKTLRTIAGNLNVASFNTFHGVSPMPDSLDPINMAWQLADLPQEHFVGEADKVVPRSLAEDHVKALGSTQCAKITVAPGAGHETGWIEFWRTVVSSLPKCGK